MMKKLICILLALVLCFALAVSASASEFAPSIGDKDEPDIDIPEPDPEDEWIITTVQEANAVPEWLREDYHKELLYVYNQIISGSMQLPVDDDMVIRELLDVTLLCPHNNEHVDELAAPGTTVCFAFNLGVKATDEVVVLTYIDGVWKPIESVTYLDEGWVECVFENVCPVAFCVRVAEEEPSQPTEPTKPGETTKPGGAPDTGDRAGSQLMLWATLLLVSFAAAVLLLLSQRRRKRKNGSGKHAG